MMLTVSTSIDLLRSQRRFALGVLTACLLVGPRSVRAQTIEELPANTRVSVIIRDSLTPFMDRRRSQSVTGSLQRASADSVWIQVPGSPTFGIARDKVSRMFESRGVSRSRSAISSGISMAAISMLLGGFINDREGRDRYSDVGVYAAAGFGAGAITGAIFPFERWRRIKNK